MTDAPAVSDWLAEALRREGLDTVEGAFAYAGGRDMTSPDLGHRERWHVRLSGPDGQPADVFMKRYEREPVLWRLRRLWTHGPGLGPAGVEAANIRAVRAAGLPTMDVVAWGEQRDVLGVRRGYVVVSAVPGEALEQCAEGFLSRHAGDEPSLAEFTRLLAELVGRFHAAGFVHRDLYTSHIYLRERSGGELDLHLIDLARVFRPRRRAFRWRVKDLAQLKHSMPPEWVAGRWEAFLGRYLELAGAVGASRERWAAAVDRKLRRMRRRLESPRYRALMARHLRH